MKVAIVNCFDTYEDRVDLLYEFFIEQGHNVTVIHSDFRHFKKEHRKDIILEIDVFANKGNNIADFESEVDSVETKFDNIIYSDNTQNLHFYLENILQLSEMYEHLRRKQLRFLLKYYKK